MPGAQYKQLVSNLKRDGVLTSSPLIYEGVVLSGNHRVQAAIDVGIEKADCIEITTKLTEQQKVAIQLSHNSITGQDDPNILSSLYESLDLSFKQYSGLTDEILKIDDIDISALSVGAPKYEELNILFLPEDLEAFEQRLNELNKKANKPDVHTARFEDFNAFFDAIVKVKAKFNIHNSAIALSRMVDLALERLEQIEDAPSDEINET